MTERPAAPGKCVEHGRGSVRHTMRKINGGAASEAVTFACGCTWAADWIGEPYGWKTTETVVISA